MNKIFLATLLVVTIQAQAADIFGQLIINGNGCSATSKNLIENSGKPSEIPVTIKFDKKDQPSIVRKSCQFRLPVKLGANQKVVVSNVSQSVKLSSVKETSVKSNLELFFAGQKGKPLAKEVKGSSFNETIKLAGVVAESKCGDVAAMLAGNLSVTANGPNAAEADLGPIQLEIQIQDCK